ncbi:MAG: transporter [Thermodesulfobacteriota bacterium]
MHVFRSDSLSLPVAVLGWFVLGAFTAHAAHPLITDDAGSAGKGGFQLEITGEFAHDRETRADGSMEKRETVDAALTLTYGFTEQIDLAVRAPYQWLSSRRGDDPVARANGISDLSLDLKWRIFEQGGWGLALKPGITLPTGDEDMGFGSGRAAYRLFFITTKKREPWAFHLNLGYIRNDNNAADRRNLWHASLAGEFALIRNLKAAANVGIQTNPATGSGTHPAFALGGLLYDLSETISLNAGVKFGLTAPEADVSYLAGITFKL